jgi:hypothetical protein
MPVISMFYGIVIRMYFYDDRQHHAPHVHAEYAGDRAVFRIDDGELLAGGLPSGKARLVQAWIEIHRDELMANWRLALNGEEVFRIEPLK